MQLLGAFRHLGLEIGVGALQRLLVRLEVVGHAIEALAEIGELIAPGNGDAMREIALGKHARAAQQLGERGAEPLQEQHHQRERDQNGEDRVNLTDPLKPAQQPRGIGIDPEIQPRIFDAFAQGEPAIRARFGGLGLGLAISKRIIDLHRGTIAVRSAGRDQGSAFIIKLASSGRPSAEAPDRAPIELAPQRPAQILIVEDHEDTVRVLGKILRTTGYAVTACGSLAEARDVAARQRFDLLISDLGLPDGSGLELMRHLRGIQQITGIALSGFGTSADVEESEAAGFATHLTKPVDIATLERALTSAHGDDTHTS